MCKKTMSVGCRCCGPGPFTRGRGPAAFLGGPLYFYDRANRKVGPTGLPAYANTLNALLAATAASRHTIWGGVRPSPDNNGWDLYYLRQRPIDTFGMQSPGPLSCYKFNTRSLTETLLWQHAVPNEFYPGLGTGYGWVAQFAHDAFTPGARFQFFDRFRLVGDQIVALAYASGQPSVLDGASLVRFPLATGPVQDFFCWGIESLGVNNQWWHGSISGAGSNNILLNLKTLGEGGVVFGEKSDPGEVVDLRPFITKGVTDTMEFSPVLSLSVLNPHDPTIQTDNTFTVAEVMPYGHVGQVDYNLIIRRASAYARMAWEGGGFYAAGTYWKSHTTSQGSPLLAKYGTNPIDSTVGHNTPELRRTLGWANGSSILLSDEQYATAIADVAANVDGFTGGGVYAVPGQKYAMLPAGFVQDTSGFLASGGFNHTFRAWWKYSGGQLTLMNVAGPEAGPNGTDPIHMFFPASGER